MKKTTRKAVKKEEKEEEYEIIDIPIETKRESRVKEPFTHDRMILKNSDPREKYVSHTGRFINTLKWGQRKLILTNLQFINLYWDPSKVPSPTFVYVGAAPGVAINVASILYPDIKWELYDSNDMNRGLPKENVTFHKRYFTSEDVDKYKGRDDIFFISDIRNPDYEKNNKGKEAKNEEIVILDMLLQQQWVLDIDPVAAQLKFRLAYIYNEIDEGLYPYLQGTVYFQGYAGKKSSECRLVPTRNEEGKYYIREWSSLQYEEQLYYHNGNVREPSKSTFNNPYTGKDDNISPGDNPELTNDWESHYEVLIIRDYLKKAKLEDNLENVLKISQFITDEINRVRNGKEKTLSSERIKQRSVA